MVAEKVAIRSRLNERERTLVDEAKQREGIETDSEFIRFLLHWYLVQCRLDTWGKQLKVRE